MKILPTKKCFKDPSQLIKFAILFICAIFTFSQVTQCVKKFIHPPTATYSNFVLNDSIRYPCLTVCRRPSFKTEVFQRDRRDIGNLEDFIDIAEELSDIRLPKRYIRDVANPMEFYIKDNFGITEFGIYSQSLKSTFAFRYFNFSKHSLTELIENATYNYEEMFYQYAYASRGGSNTSSDLIKLTNIFRIDKGRCFIFQPLQMSNIFSVSGGFMFYLKHNVTSQSINEYGISTHGFQFYLHDPNEILTDDEEEKNNFLEYLDLEASEDMRIRLEIEEFGRASTKQNVCIDDNEYSRSKCEELCVNKQIVQATNCTLPWMMLSENEENNTFEECNTYTSVRKSIRLYSSQIIREEYLKNCSCPDSCSFTVYRTSVISRRSIEPVLAPNCMISIYSTNLVFKMSEILGYDSNQLLSDIGGSLGFLLGLSVISLICFVEELSKLIFRLFFKRKAKLERNNSEEVQSNNQQVNDIDQNTEQEKNVDEKKDLEHEYTNIQDFINNYQNVCSKKYNDNKSNRNIVNDVVK